MSRAKFDFRDRSAPSSKHDLDTTESFRLHNQPCTIVCTRNLVNVRTCIMQRSM